MSDSICCIYLGTETLSAITLRRGKKQQWTPSGAALQLLAAEDQDNPAGALRAAAKAARQSKSPVTLCLPKLHATLRKALLPSIDAAELAQMARFEAERHIPLHPERHTTGYHILRSMGVEGSEVLLGAVDGPIIEKALQAAAEAGLAVDGLTLSSVGLVNTLIYARREWLRGRTSAILSVGLDTLDIVLMSEERVLLARSVQMDLRGVLEAWAGYRQGEGARPDAARLAHAARMIDCLAPHGEMGAAPSAATPAAPGETIPAQLPGHLVEGWMERVIQELRRTYDFARREVKCPPVDALVLTGEGAAVRNLDQFLLTNLQAELLILNPFEGVADAAALKAPFGGLEFAVPFGAAIAGQFPGSYRLDLIPQAFHRNLARKSVYRRLAFTFVLLAIAIGLGVASYLRLEDINSQTVRDYTKLIGQMKPRAEELGEMKSKLDLISKFKNDKNAALPVLNTLANSPEIPDALALTRIDYTKGKMVAVDGEARDVPSFNRYITELQGTGNFSAVTPIDQHTAAVFGQQVYQFRVECPLKQLEPPAKPKAGGHS